MKRLFNLLLAFLMALGFNVDVTWRNNDQTYNPETFYHASTDGKISSTRSYESGKYEKDTLLCTVSTQVVKDSKVITTEPYTTYWVGVTTPMELDTMQVNMHAGDSVVAPFDGKIVQINTGTPDGITAYFGFTIDYEHYYILEMENLERLYCCRNRGSTAPEAGWLSHSVDVTGNTLHAGELLGKANGNTHLRLYASSSSYEFVQSMGVESSGMGVLFSDALK